MSAGKIYKLLHKDPQGQLFIIKISDGFVNNPYSIFYTREHLFSGLIRFSFFFDQLPADTTGTQIEWSTDGGLTWTTNNGNTVSPRTVELVNLVYIFRFIIQRPGGNETFYPGTTELNTEIVEGSADSVRISVINNDEDKFQVFRAKNAIIKILSTNSINLDCFAQGPAYDSRFYTTIAVNADANIIFRGFLSMSDLSEPFRSPRNILTLVATDKLGSLKKVALTDFDGVNPSGMFRIADYLTWALSKTGLSLPLNAVMNIRQGRGSLVSQSLFSVSGNHIVVSTFTDVGFFYAGQIIEVTGTVSNNGTYHVQSATFLAGAVTVEIEETITVPESGVITTFQDVDSTKHFYDNTYIDAKTFEKEINTSDDCSTVIEKLLRKDAYVFQRNGEWWIRRPDEFDQNPVYVSVFNPDGTFKEHLASTSFDKEVKKPVPSLPAPIWLSNAQTKAVLNGQHKFDKLTYNYNTPKEVPCNVDFSRGELFETVSADEKKFFIECWSKILFDNPGIPDTDIYVRRTYVNGSEDTRYVVIKQSGTAHNALISEAIPVVIRDRFEMSFQRKLNSNVGGGPGFYRNSIAQIRLYGDDGTYWIFKGPVSTDPKGKWMTSNSTFTANQNYIVVEGDLSDDLTEEVTSYGDKVIPDMPATGYIRIVLIQGSHGTTKDILMPPPSIRYIPYLNGRYEKITGQSSQVTQPGIFNDQGEDEVFITDSPRRLFKGALQRISRYKELFSGSVTFVAPNSFQIAGYKVDQFGKNQRLQISGTALNNGLQMVKSVSYSLIASATIIEVYGTINDETINAIISEAVYSLIDRCFNAAVYPAGPPDYTYTHLFSYIQIFSVFNQYKQVTRTIRAILQGLDADSLDSLGRCNIPDLIHSIYLRDPSPNSNNKQFQMLSFDQDTRWSKWTGTFKEVYNISTGRFYDDQYELKFIE